MLVIREPDDRHVTSIRQSVFSAERRLSLPAIGLYCWLADLPRPVRLGEIEARFGINATQRTFLVDELRRADLLEPEAAVS